MSKYVLCLGLLLSLQAFSMGQEPARFLGYQCGYAVWILSEGDTREGGVAFCEGKMENNQADALASAHGICRNRNYSQTINAIECYRVSQGRYGKIRELSYSATFI